MKQRDKNKLKKIAPIFGFAVGILLFAGYQSKTKPAPHPEPQVSQIPQVTQTPQKPSYQDGFRYQNSPGRYGVPYADLCYATDDGSDSAKDVCFHCLGDNRLVLAVYHSDINDTPLCMNLKTHAYSKALSGRLEFKK